MKKEVNANVKMKALYLIFVSIVMLSCDSGETFVTINPENSTYLEPFGEREYTYDSEGQVIDTIYHTIPPFYLTAHDGSIITDKTVKGKIYVADFFFTSCPSICPIMTSSMKVLHENTKDIEELLILSHTIDPERDTLAQLNKYIKAHELDTRDDWFFLYGSQEYVYEIGKDGYLINADVDKEAEGGFLHSEHFVLVDREGRIRGMYLGTSPEEVNQLEKDIRYLINVEYGE